MEEIFQLIWDGIFKLSQGEKLDLFANYKHWIKSIVLYFL